MGQAPALKDGLVEHRLQRLVLANTIAVRSQSYLLWNDKNSALYVELTTSMQRWL